MTCQESGKCLSLLSSHLYSCVFERGVGISTAVDRISGVPKILTSGCSSHAIQVDGHATNPPDDGLISCINQCHCMTDWREAGKSLCWSSWLARKFAIPICIRVSRCENFLRMLWFIIDQIISLERTGFHWQFFYAYFHNSVPFPR